MGDLAVGDPAEYVFDADGTLVVYRSGDGHIWELYGHPAQGWSAGDLPAATGLLDELRLTESELSS
jgi:hypothetical protein